MHFTYLVFVWYDIILWLEGYNLRVIVSDAGLCSSQQIGIIIMIFHYIVLVSDHCECRYPFVAHEIINYFDIFIFSLNKRNHSDGGGRWEKRLYCCVPLFLQSLFLQVNQKQILLIIIMRISRAPIYHTRWEHRALKYPIGTSHYHRLTVV